MRWVGLLLGAFAACACTEEAQRCFEPADWSAGPIIAALCVIATSAGERRILLATIPPFAASEYHSAKAEATRVQASRWIRANWAGGDVIDLDLILGNPGDRSRLRPAFDLGDGLHPNEAGSADFAAAVAAMVRSG